MSQKHFLIIGGTGFLGQALIATGLKRGWQITLVSRNVNKAYLLFGQQVQVVSHINELSKECYFDAVINLAGEPIFGKRWTEHRKKTLRESRINLTQSLLAYLATLPIRPEVLINASAIGIYGNHLSNELKQVSQAKSFSQDLCLQWEDAARQAEKLNIRVCLIRTGVVLAKDGGMLEKMLPAFRLGLGCQFGNGQQWFSWIHVQDWLNIIEFLLIHPEYSGAFNATAPNPVTNSDFTQALAKLLHRPAFLTTPAYVLNLLLGEMAELLLISQKIQPERLLSAGFQFQFATLNTALAAILSSK